MPSTNSVVPSKASLRQQMALRCEALEPGDALSAGRAMAATLLARSEWSRAGRVALFAGLADEPDTRPVFDAIQSAGKLAFFPRCRDDGALDMVRIRNWQELRKGRFGILEPPGEGVPEPLSGLDLMLLPGVAFDSRGRRLGRGGGFYDRSLARVGDQKGPKTVGVGFAFRLIERVPADSHDRRVDAVLTDRGWTESAEPE